MVAQAYEEQGFGGLTFDIKNAQTVAQEYFNDITNPWGFLTAIRLVARLKKRGLAHTALESSNLIYLCRAKTCRVESNEFCGNADYAKVRYSNMMIQRMLLIWAFCVALRVRWLTEQPGSSCLRFMRSNFQWIPSPYPQGEIRTIHGFMGSFNSRTKKASYWIGDAEFLETMQQPLPPDKFRRTDVRVLPAKLVRFSGQVDKIRDSEHYTIEYGRHVFRAWHESVFNGIDAGKFNEYEFPDSESDDSLTESDWDRTEYTGDVESFWQYAGFIQLSQELDVPLDSLMADHA